MKKLLLSALAALALVSCSPKELVFIQMSDPQIGFKDKTEGYAKTDSLMQLAVEAINRIKPALVVITGDLVNNTADSLQKAVYLKNIAAIDKKVKVYALPGNHDMRPWTQEHYDEFIEFNGYDRFSVKVDGNAFIGFDSCCIKDSIAVKEAEQLEWLQAELTKAQGCKNIFLFTHCPIFREDINEDEDYFNFSKLKRVEYLSFFKIFNVSAVFAGHTHKDYVSSYDGIELITAGPVGSPLHGGFSGLNVIHVAPDGKWNCVYSSAPEAE